MIAEALALLFGSPAPAVEPPRVVDVRYRRRHRKRAVYVPSEADLDPRKVKSLRVLQGDDGKWIVDRGIEDVYSRVPPFNKGSPP